MKPIRPILLLLLLLVVVPSYAYSQNATKIKPVKLNAFTWGYQDLLGEWIISPQFSKADSFTNDDIAIVGIADFEIKQNSVIGATMSTSDINKALYPKEFGLIDLNGDILVKYKYDATQKQKDDKYAKALKAVSKRRQAGVYDDIYARLAQIDADILAHQQREQARKDSILMAQELLKKRADSIATAKRVADSLNLAKEREIIARISSGNGLSLSKVKVTGHGMLLSKDETWQEYTVRMDDFNRICVTYEGTTRLRGELDVLKTIYESDWSLLSDNLFQSIEISKMTVEILQGAYTKKFGAFSFLVTINFNDFNSIYTDEEANLTVSYAISQVERFISSFMNHYQNSAYIVEPLFQVKVGGREGITVGIVDKQGNGASLEDAKRICNESLRSLRRK